MRKMNLFALLCIVGTHSKLVIKSPDELRSEFQNRYSHGELTYSLGNFGSPPYGTTLHGQIAYSPINHFGCSPYSTLPYEYESSPTPIILVDRGQCDFVVKVKNAQDAGAKAVIIMNNHYYEEIDKVIMVDPGTAGNLYLPALLIGKPDGDTLLNFLTRNPEKTIEVTINFDMRKTTRQIKYTI